MNSLFNSTLELSLRLMLLLNSSKDPQTMDMLSAADFITTYAKCFEISDVNLNGDNDLMFSEFASRRQIVKETLIELVIRGIVIPKETSRGFVFIISKIGHEQVAYIDGEYALQYSKLAIQTYNFISKRNEQRVIADINKKAALSLRKVSAHV